MTKKSSEMLTCTQHSKQDTPIHASDAADNETLPIYENICCSKVTADPRHSAPDVQDEPFYINALPHTKSEISAGVSLGKYTQKWQQLDMQQANTNDVLVSHPRSCGDSKKGRPRSFWFGLDLTGTV